MWILIRLVERQKRAIGIVASFLIEVNFGHDGQRAGFCWSR
jgi:hypothetical protein